MQNESLQNLLHFKKQVYGKATNSMQISWAALTTDYPAFPGFKEFHSHSFILESLATSSTWPKSGLRNFRVTRDDRLPGHMLQHTRTPPGLTTHLPPAMSRKLVSCPCPAILCWHHDDMPHRCCGFPQPCRGCDPALSSGVGAGSWREREPWNSSCSSSWSSGGKPAPRPGVQRPQVNSSRARCSPGLSSNVTEDVTRWHYLRQPYILFFLICMYCMTFELWKITRGFALSFNLTRNHQWCKLPSIEPGTEVWAEILEKEDCLQCCFLTSLLKCWCIM